MHRLFFVLISLIATDVLAVDVANLYQSYIPVATQNDEVRQQAAPDVLRQVLLKVVGDRAALDVVELSALLSQADSFVQRYQYRQVNKISDDITEPEHLEILLLFNEGDLNHALTNLGLPLWGKSRPEVLVLLAVDDGKKQAILSTHDTHDLLVQSVQKVAELRGLPIIMPLMDLTDQRQILFADLWAGLSEPIASALQRYGSPIILMASVLVDTNGAIQVRWQTVINGESERWQSRGDINTAMQAGIEELTDRIARRFSQVINNNQDATILSLKISDVRNYTDYSRLLVYLATLQHVSNVKVSRLATDTLDISLSLKGDLAMLNQTLAIDRVLMFELVPTENALSYRLSP